MKARVNRPYERIPAGPGSAPVAARRGGARSANGAVILMLLLAGLAVLAAAGCATTPADRARTMPDVVQALAPEDRERVLAGTIAVGDTPDMVYLAWGRPDRTSRTTRQDGETETWTYLGYYSEYVDVHPLSRPTSRWYYDRRLKRHVRIREDYPFHDTIIHRRAYARRRVEFRDDAVIAFEIVTR